MTTVPELLLAVQDLDTAIDQARHRMARLPERRELEETAQAIAAGEAAGEEARARRDEVAKRQRSLEGELEKTEKRIAEINHQLSSGGIAAAREVEALNASVDHLREQVSDLEDGILEALEEREPLDEMVAAVAGDLAHLGEKRRHQAETVERLTESITAEISELETKREAAVAEVPKSPLSTYERLRPRLDGVAVARLVGNHCDGCHLTLPAKEMDEIRHASDEELLYCDQCGRILVRPHTAAANSGDGPAAGSAGDE